MSASVRLEDEAFSDERYEDLAAFAGLVDSDHARGKMARLWRQCTIEGTHKLENHLVMRVLGSSGVDALVRARLGERIGDTHVRIKGTKGRIEWLEQLRSNGRKGGRPRKKAPKPSGYGGGNPSGSGAAKPSGFENQNPPAPAPAPALKEEQPPAADDSIRPAVDAFDAYFRAANGGSKPTWGPKQVSMLKTLAKKHSVAEVVRRIESLRSKPPSFPPQPWDLATFIANADRCAAQPSITWNAPIA